MSNTNNNTNSLENSHNSNTSATSLCIGCSEFFGNPHTESMCSKCYK